MAFSKLGTPPRRPYVFFRSKIYAPPRFMLAVNGWKIIMLAGWKRLTIPTGCPRHCGPCFWASECHVGFQVHVVFSLFCWQCPRFGNRDLSSICLASGLRETCEDTSNNDSKSWWVKNSHALSTPRGEHTSFFSFFNADWALVDIITFRSNATRYTLTTAWG